MPVAAPLPVTSAPPWTLRERWAAAFFVLYLAVQLAVPIWKLMQPERPGRFGWQMFAGTEVRVRFVAIGEDGSEQNLDPIPFQVARRLDLRLDEAFPRFVCRQQQGSVRAVRVVRAESPAREILCRP
jgi:hypothetical protein